MMEQSTSYVRNLTSLPLIVIQCVLLKGAKEDYVKDLEDKMWFLGANLLL